MSDPVIFQVEHGAFALAVLDTAEPGYEESWQTPGGTDITTVTMADYDAAGVSNSWMCQITKGVLTVASDTTTVDVPATWCSPAKSVPQPAQSTFTLEGTFLQDPTIGEGLSAFLFEHDTDKAYFLLGLTDDPNPPRACGVLRLSAGDFGGEARNILTADVSWPLDRKPDVWFGKSVTDPNARVVYGSGAAPAIAGVTAGTPGSFQPSGAAVPANLVALKADPAVGTTGTNKPVGAWTTGQYVDLADASQASWSGTDWVTGVAP